MKPQQILSLYEVLKETHECDTSEQIAPTYYRNKDDLAKDHFVDNILVESNVELYLFLVLFSHNTNDVTTYKKFKLISDLIRNNKVVNYMDHFYKKKQKYYEALLSLKSYVLKCLRENKPMRMSQLKEIPYVGFKTGALILNHFEEKVHPIVDVNVHKAFNIITGLRLSADEVYLVLCQLPDLTHNDYSSYELANLLWTHRKLCLKLNPHCSNRRNQYLKCDRCASLQHKYLSRIQEI